MGCNTANGNVHTPSGGGDGVTENEGGAFRARLPVDSIPSPVKRALASVYYRYLSWDADRSHTIKSLAVERVSDAPQHVLVIVIDALRPDHEPDIPLAFSRAVTPGTWTFPAVTSIHTGTYPHEHEAVAHTHPDDETYVLPEQAKTTETLAHTMEAAGYDTYAGLAFMTPFLAIRNWYATHRVYRDVRTERVVNDYLDWRAGRDRTFAYLHLGDLHEPIDPPARYVEAHSVDTSVDDLGQMTRYTDDYDGGEECRRFRCERLKLYGAALKYVEDTLRPLIDRIADDTAILVTGDHGEAHWEHHKLDRQFTDSRPNYGLGHGGTPYDMVARVPVAFRTPEGDVQIHGGHASLRDVPTTVAAATLVESPFDGHQWQGTIPDDRSVVCEASRYGAERKAVYRRDMKLIRSETDDVTLTSTLHPTEGEVFCELPRETVAELQAAVPDYWSDGRIASQTSRMVKEQLTALGYK